MVVGAWWVMGVVIVNVRETWEWWRLQGVGVRGKGLGVLAGGKWQGQWRGIEGVSREGMSVGGGWWMVRGRW